ncbi:hypothetical protein F2Q69_00061356 [Brassica cretica]|uniref:Uncharacterized protein n=1 Tax=Brassica cretica TaxID=69181 RepID=A0A8S9RQQ2_BRACR|nr:hypothetical protein F2Q69_00061356 [Brassica cretica]
MGSRVSMPSQKWDPGIGDEIRNGAEDQQRKDLGGSEWGSSSDLRRLERVFEKWNWGVLRMFWGVVINGNQNQQHKERDGRDYYGKGKGKMVEEADSKWVKVADRGNKGSFTNHRSYKGDGNGSRHRSSRREEHRAEGQGQ